MVQIVDGSSRRVPIASMGNKDGAFSPNHLRCVNELADIDEDGDADEEKCVDALEVLSFS
jgi:hypothetical protein